jgi:hypothetical protein
MLLLPVALMLTIVGALAYAMTRDGSISAAAVDAQYDTEVARYLAEAGVNLAKWQNEQRGCNSEASFGTIADLPGGSVKLNNIDDIKHGLRVDVTSKTTAGASVRLTRDVLVHDIINLPPGVTLGGLTGNDTTIIKDSPLTGPQLSALPYLELSDGKSHGLIRFAPGLPENPMVIRAELKLHAFRSNSTQPRKLIVHRLMRNDWSAGNATWTKPWVNAGGDYIGLPITSAPVTTGLTILRIEGLVDAWANERIPNYGLLLKPDGMLGDQFHSFDSNTYAPQLVVRYAPRCG